MAYDQILYVETSGSSSGDGSITSPYSRIERAISNSTGSDILINVGEGEIAINELAGLSKASAKVTIVGQGLNTTLVIHTTNTPR